jgi:hypothetical protein
MTASNPVAGIWAAASEETLEHARRYRENLNRIMFGDRDAFHESQDRAAEERDTMRRELRDELRENRKAS